MVVTVKTWCLWGRNGVDLVGGFRYTLYITRDVTSNDDSSNLWVRRAGAEVDVVAMTKTGCCRDATMDSVTIAVMEDDE